MFIIPAAPAQEFSAEREPPHDHVELPTGFDPQRQPIIAQHFFGLGPARVRKLQRQVVRAITRVYTLKADGCYSNARR